MHQRVTKTIPEKKNEGATFFCLPKILGKEGKDLGTKKGWFFLLSVPPNRPKILDKKKIKARFFLPTKNPGVKKNEGETFFAY